MTTKPTMMSTSIMGNSAQAEASIRMILGYVTLGANARYEH
jgi:hypothetical protein